MTRYLKVFFEIVWFKIALLTGIVLAFSPFLIILSKGKPLPILVFACIYFAIVIGHVLSALYDTKEFIKKENSNLLQKIKGIA